MLTGDNPHTAAAIAAQVESTQLAATSCRRTSCVKWKRARPTARGSAWSATDQRRAGPGPRRHRLRHGRGGHRHGHRDRRRRADGRRPAQVAAIRPAVAHHHAILVQNITLALGIKAVFLALTLAGKAPCGWRYSPTWAPACWWCSTVCDCCASVSERPHWPPSPTQVGLFLPWGAQAGDGIPAGTLPWLPASGRKPVRRAFMTSDGVPRPRRKPTVQSENFRFFEPLNQRGVTKVHGQSPSPETEAWQRLAQ